MAQTVFNRIEKKFLLDQEQYEAMRLALDNDMEMDVYGEHNIRNIYFDTKNDELVRTSIEKPKYKEKFRIRCYGEPSEQSNIFMEIKKKYNGLVNKRRVVLTQPEAKAYLYEGIHPKEAGQKQIFDEIDYFLCHYDLQPKMYLAYDRIALYGKADSEFRITFDKNIRCRMTALSLANDEDTIRLLEKGYYIMEVKIINAMPLWFVDILSELEIRTASFSKYGNAYKRNLLYGYYDYSGDVFETYEAQLPKAVYQVAPEQLITQPV